MKEERGGGEGRRPEGRKLRKGQKNSKGGSAECRVRAGLSANYGRGLRDINNTAEGSYK